jgi:5-methylthioadenosine/S-adenosylhomocysteine deaminase
MPDLLIIGGAILAQTGWIEPGYLTIQGQAIATIAAGPPPAELRQSAAQVFEARQSALLPGLLNGHTHLSQSFMRGLAGGRALLPWLKELIWPLQNAISPEELRFSALLGLVENLRGGVTELVDHHKITATPAHTQAVCAAAEQVGLRFTLARAWSDRGKNAESADAILADLGQLFERYQNHPLIRVANGPLALWRCSAGLLGETHRLARRYGAFTHAHVSESQDEVQMSVEEYGLRPVHWLASLGLLDPHFQLVHAVWVDAGEIAAIAQAGAPVIHCPVSNAVLGSGIAPTPGLLRQGVGLRLGSDGAASNDTQDMWETLKSALGFARAAALDATLLPPRQALLLATGGRLLAPGAPADLIIVNLAHPRLSPINDLDSALVLAGRASDVDSVLVGGRFLMRSGRVLVVDEQELLEQCRQANRELRQRAGLDGVG